MFQVEFLIVNSEPATFDKKKSRHQQSVIKSKTPVNLQNKIPAR